MRFSGWLLGNHWLSCSSHGSTKGTSRHTGLCIQHCLKRKIISPTSLTIFVGKPAVILLWIHLKVFKWKFCRKKECLPRFFLFFLFYQNNLNFLNRLCWLQVQGFLSRVYEQFSGILLMVQLNRIPVFGAKNKTPLPFGEKSTCLLKK